MDLSRIAPDAYRKLAQLESIIAPHIEPKLLHLLKLRASQINGCAYCIAMHTHEALQDGESPIRLTSLDAWEESDRFEERERVLLRWVDEVTLIATTRASAGAFADLKSHFDESEIGWLTMAIVTINSWNRVAIASRAQYRTTERKAQLSN
ncbi:carboxymuconolactone decarboxylase family protein [Sphingomonas sp. KRR8]|uniref:carboxymuconolactone decarboxylase family protein n=1 Tax=Sphingomonas sp. KRR8 TaxID=2942996 RepID=UPI00201FFC2A|nr:carboxymuconolactone decarboxylase family protein [Sphingomonas sp. KRR8]URD61834.1 carboxymuconolactone decarboxylase family protein [Sphingomonas sp. KRR8]